MENKTAQQLIDECNHYDYNLKKVRNELNLAWLINDVKKQFEALQ